MKPKRKSAFLSLCALTSCFVLGTQLAEAVTVFSNNFEDGNLTPETGTWTFAATSANTSVVATTGGADPTLGNNVGLIDQNAIALDLTLNLTSTVSLAGGNTVSIDFDVAARRTNGNVKTIFVDALDSSDNIVVRFVLGDANAFGNGAGDRQRPGHDPTSAGNANTGNSVFTGTGAPGSFWFGADTTPATFDVIRDAHMSLTIGATSFDFSSTRASGASYSTTGIANRDAGTFADIASVKLTSVGTNYGVYLDNIVVEGTVVPEPSAALLGGLGMLALLRRRRA